MTPATMWCWATQRLHGCGMSCPRILIAPLRNDCTAQKCWTIPLPTRPLWIEQLHCTEPPLSLHSHVPADDSLTDSRRLTPRYAPMRVTEPGHCSCAETLEAAGYPRIVLPVEPWEVVRWAYSYERQNRTGDPFTRDAGHVLTYNKITSALLLHHTRRAEVPCGVHIGHSTGDARCYDADSFADDHTTFQGNHIVPCPPPS